MESSSDFFIFKEFKVRNTSSAMKVNTDGVLLGAWTSLPMHREEVRILDVGTGTGVISLVVAQRLANNNKKFRIDAIDIDTPSIEEADYNFDNSPWRENLNAYEYPLQSFPQNNTYNLIISNPPYFINSLKASTKRKHDARHTDNLTHNELLQGIRRGLSNDGVFSVILPSEEATLFIEAASRYSLFPRRICKVSTIKGRAPKRYMIEFVTQESISISEKKVPPITWEHLEIQFDGEFTEQYKLLLKEFYINF